MFMDEGRFGRVDLPQRCWAPSGMRPACPAQIIREYSYAFAAVSPEDGVLESMIYYRADSDVMDCFLRQISEAISDEHVMLFMDKAAWHTTKKLHIPENISISFLPPYSPQLNPTEVLWNELRKEHFHHRVFKSMDAVDDQLEIALRQMSENPARVKRFSAFHWMNL